MTFVSEESLLSNYISIMKNLLVLLFLMPGSLLAQDEFSLTEKVKSVLGFTVPTISADELSEMKSVKVLDARDREEYNVSHLPNALYVGDKDFSLSKLEGVSKTDTLVVYCTVGYRSEQIGEKLEKAGYENVLNLFGGIFSWKNNGGTVVDNTGSPTEKVHCYNKSWSLFLLEGEKVY